MVVRIYDFFCFFSKNEPGTTFIRITILKVRSNQKADWRAIDSPKKRTDKFDLFAVKNKKGNKKNSSVCFLGKSMVRQFAFEIN